MINAVKVLIFSPFSALTKPTWTPEPQPWNVFVLSAPRRWQKLLSPQLQIYLSLVCSIHHHHLLCFLATLVCSPWIVLGSPFFFFFPFCLVYTCPAVCCITLGTSFQVKSSSKYSVSTKESDFFFSLTGCILLLLALNLQGIASLMWVDYKSTTDPVLEELLPHQLLASYCYSTWAVLKKTMFLPWGLGYSKFGF